MSKFKYIDDSIELNFRMSSVVLETIKEAEDFLKQSQQTLEVLLKHDS